MQALPAFRAQGWQKRLPLPKPFFMKIDTVQIDRYVRDLP